MDDGQTQPTQAQSDSQPFGFTEGIGLAPVENNQTGNSVNTEEYSLHDPEELKEQQANLGNIAMTTPSSSEPMPGNTEADPLQPPTEFMPLPDKPAETPVVGIPENLGQIGDITSAPTANEQTEESPVSPKDISDATKKKLFKAFADKQVNGGEDIRLVKEIEENPNPEEMADQWAEARKIANEPEGEGA